MPRKPPRPGAPVRGSRTGRPIMALMDLLGRRGALRVLWVLREARLPFRAPHDARGGGGPAGAEPEAPRAPRERTGRRGGERGLRAHGAGTRAPAVPAAARGVVQAVGSRPRAGISHVSAGALTSRNARCSVGDGELGRTAAATRLVRLVSASRRAARHPLERSR